MNGLPRKYIFLPVLRPVRDNPVTGQLKVSAETSALRISRPPPVIITRVVLPTPSMFLLFLSLIPTVLPLRLLFYVPTLSYSHVAFNAGLAHKLVEAGHHVVQLDEPEWRRAVFQTMIQAVVDESVSYNSSHFEVIRKYVGVAPGEAKSLLWTNPGPFDEASPLDPKILWKFIRVSNLFVNICGGCFPSRPPLTPFSSDGGSAFPRRDPSQKV